MLNNANPHSSLIGRAPFAPNPRGTLREYRPDVGRSALIRVLSRRNLGQIDLLGETVPSENTLNVYYSSPTSHSSRIAHSTWHSSQDERRHSTDLTQPLPSHALTFL